tara:strand:- start:112 stop:339 length:228 start_codon:yes stop_codon:yes gene_type:complete
MESLFLIRCHKILDHHQVEVAVVIVDSIQDLIISAESIELKELKIPTFATSGDQDTLKDETNYYYFVIFNNIWRD